MKAVCTQENLNKGLAIVSHIAGKNISLPILNNILIKARDGFLTLVGTNLDIGIKTKIRGKIESDGELTVQARLLTEYINLLSSQNITLIKKDNDIQIQTNEQNTVIKGQPADEYPIIPEVNETDGVLISKADFKQALDQVIFSASYDDTRPEISGVYIIVDNNKMFLVATDSYRLAEKQLEVSSSEYDHIDKIIPLRVLQEVLRVLGDKGDIKIYFSDNQVVFKMDETIIISRLIEGNYPDYKQIIPDGSKTKAEFNKNDLLKLVKAASLFTKTGINDILIEFEPKGEVKISAINTQLGENKSSMKADIKGEKNKIVFNYKYLVDGLQHMGSSKVELQITSPEIPAILKPVGSDDYMYLIMPIRQ